jgi:hypothetical protein
MPRCADVECGRWRPERLVPRWATGIRFNGRWYCSRECVEHAARAGLDTPVVPAASVGASLPPLRLGVLLRHLGALSEQGLTSALESQRESGLRLGAELRRREMVPSEPILKALAAQSGVSYLATFDARRVMEGPSWLPVETVRALGLVPFDLDETLRQVKVVTAAPVPRAAMRALVKLTGWSAEPFLVEDEVWEHAMRAYRPARMASELGEAIAVNGVAAAAARVADTAFADRTLTMRTASCDAYTWVRLEGPKHVSDLLVSPQDRGPQRARLLDGVEDRGPQRARLRDGVEERVNARRSI